LLNSCTVIWRNTVKTTRTDLMDFIIKNKPANIEISAKQIGTLFTGKLYVIQNTTKIEIWSQNSPQVALILPLDFPNFTISFDNFNLTASGKSVRYSPNWDQLWINLHFKNECEYDELSKCLFKGILLRALNNEINTSLLKLPMHGVEVPKELQDLVGSPFAYKFELGKYKSKIQSRIKTIHDFLQLIS
jgi:hypothetical protein